jgi:predicted neuraminidase
MLNRWFPSLVFVLGLLAVLATNTLPEPPQFAQPESAHAALAAKQAAALPASFVWSDLPRPTPSAHAATLAEVLPGDAAFAASAGQRLAPVQLIAAWFGGSREGAADVSLYQSEWRVDASWSPAHEIMTRQKAERELGRNIRKLGNPLIVTERGRLHLFFVSVSYGGWAGSAINRSQSTDGGKNWQPAQRIVTSPFFNLSTLVRNQGSWLTDGSLGLPVYHEFVNKHGEWLRLNPEGRVLAKERMAMPRATLQPAVVALDGQHAVAALRDAGPGENQVQWSETRDAGRSWQGSSARAIPNPNSAVAMIGLRDGTLLMACNPIGGNRNRLALLRSSDQGSTWTLAHVVEESANDRDEFSYPALIQDSTGTIHLVYTWMRQGIRHARFTQAWLNAAGNPNAPAVPR